MKSPICLITVMLRLVFVAILATGSAMAEKPSWAGAGNGNKDQRSEQREVKKGEWKNEQRNERSEGDAQSQRGGFDDGRRGHFEDRHRVVVRSYYADQFRNNHCPPGLAKKHNGCMPPGQAKKWKVGRPLPIDLIYYTVPQPLVLQIGLAPTGYRYVRVASDILMIAIGTGMVVDAIQDLGR